MKSKSGMRMDISLAPRDLGTVEGLMTAGGETGHLEQVVVPQRAAERPSPETERRERAKKKAKERSIDRRIERLGSC